MKMNKSDLLEIRKVLKREDPSIGWIYGFYVNDENEVCWTTFRNLLSMSEEEFHRYKDLLKKAISGQKGKQLHSLLLQTQSEMLTDIIDKANIEEDDFSEFRQNIIDSYQHVGPYYAVAAKITYDIPVKAKDNVRLDDSEYVYEAMLFCICPAKLSTPALGYIDTTGVSELTRRWSIGNPVEGWLYPAFTERQTDRNEVLYRASKTISQELVNTFFGTEIPMSLEEQKEAFSSFAEDIDMNMSSVTSFFDEIAHIESESISKESFKKLLENSDIDTSDFDNKYEEHFGKNDVNVAAISDNSLLVETDTVSIKTSTELAQFVKTQKIDGVYYLTVPVNGKVLVNGASISIEE